MTMDPPRGDELTEEVARLALLGLTQTSIAERLGVSQPTVHRHIGRARERWRERLDEDYEALLAEELARMDQLGSALEVGITGGDPASIGQALKVSERRAKLIGLDHGSRLDEVRVQLEANRLRSIVTAFTRVMDLLGVEGETRTVAARAFVAELRSPELSGPDDGSTGPGPTDGPEGPEIGD